MTSRDRPGRPRRARDHRRPDGGAMLVLAAFLLAGAAIMAMGTLATIQRTQDDVIEAHSSRLVELFLSARAETLAYVASSYTDDPNATFSARLTEHVRAHVADPIAASLRLHAAVATPTSTAQRFEHDGTALDLVKDDGTYTEVVCDAIGCTTPLPYDGANDGLVHDESGTVVAVLVWLELESGRGRITELLVAPAPPVATS